MYTSVGKKAKGHHSQVAGVGCSAKDELCLLTRVLLSA